MRLVALASDVPLPEGMPPVDDHEERLGASASTKSPEKWGELALHTIF